MKKLSSTEPNTTRQEEQPTSRKLSKEPQTKQIPATGTNPEEMASKTTASNQQNTAPRTQSRYILNKCLRYCIDRVLFSGSFVLLGFFRYFFLHPSTHHASFHPSSFHPSSFHPSITKENIKNQQNHTFIYPSIHDTYVTGSSQIQVELVIGKHFHCYATCASH